MRELIRNILREELILEMPRRLTQDEFIERSNIVHNGKYDYSSVDYKNTSTKVKIICPIHGEFEQLANDHLRGIGCKECGYGEAKKKTTKSQQDFIKQSEEKHNGKYSYEKTNYTNANKKITITCPIHGDFEQIPNAHVRGAGCLKCAGKDSKQDVFVPNAKKIHGDKYDYSKVVYINNSTPVTIICPVHGEFLQSPTNHLSQKQGCPKCGRIKAAKSNTTKLDDLIRRFEDVHGNVYDYSLVDYKNMNTKIDVICSKHGEFKVEPRNHLYLGSGCPSCMESKGEKYITTLLTENDIKFIPQKKFKDCFTMSDKGRCSILRFDFYLPDYNTIIEYDGIQHFEPVIAFGGEETFLLTKLRDEIKNQYCKDNNIKMIRVSYRIPFNEISNFILTELGLI